MDVLRKIVIGLGAIVVVALMLALASPKTVHAIVSTLVTVANTSANPVPTTAPTGVGVPVRNLVTLQCGFITDGEPACGSGYSRIGPDGSISSFTIPSGQTFVLTDVNVVLSSCAASQSCIVLVGPNLYFGSIADSNGTATVNGHLTSGAAFQYLPQLFVASPYGSFQGLTLAGYLTQ